MPTYVIDPDNGVGTDYVSGQACINGIAGVSQGNATVILEYRPTSGTADGSVNIAGLVDTTDVIIRPQSSTYKHDGTENGNALAAKVIGTGQVIIQADLPLTVQDMVVKHTDTSSGFLWGVRWANITAGASCYAISNLIIGEAPAEPSGNTVAIGLQNNINNYIINNIIYDDWDTGFSIYAQAAVTNPFYYNLLLGCRSTAIQNNGIGTQTSRTINNIVEGGIINTSGTAQQNINSGPSGGQINNTTLTYANKAARDFRLSTTDTAAINAGIDLSADAFFAVTTDILDITRDATPNIGPHETVVSSTTTITTSADAALSKAFSINTNGDAYLEKAFSLTSNADALLQKSELKEGAIADAYLEKAFILTTSADAILDKQTGIGTLADAVLLKQGLTLTTGADAVILTPTEGKRIRGYKGFKIYDPKRRIIR